MTREMRRATLTKLCKIEGFEDENDLFAAVISDSVCPGQPRLRLHRGEGARQQGGLVRGVPARDDDFGAGARGHHLMSAEKIRALNDAFRTTMTVSGALIPSRWGLTGASALVGYRRWRTGRRVRAGCWRASAAR
jgi:hypothetical protein